MFCFFSSLCFSLFYCFINCTIHFAQMNLFIILYSSSSYLYIYQNSCCTLCFYFAYFSVLFIFPFVLLKQKKRKFPTKNNERNIRGLLLHISLLRTLRGFLSSALGASEVLAKIEFQKL